MFRVVGLNSQTVGLELQPNAAVFLVRENRGTLKRLAQRVLVTLDLLAGRVRNDAGIIREAPVNQFRGKTGAAQISADMIRADLNRDFPFVIEKPLQRDRVLLTLRNAIQRLACVS